MINEPYEFSAEQNKPLIVLARLMKYAAFLFLFLAVVIGVFCGFTILKYPLLGGIFLLLTITATIFGVWTNSVSYSFKLIVETTGKDMDLLMDAINIFKQVYILQFIWLFIITLLFLGFLLSNTMSVHHTSAFIKTA